MFASWTWTRTRLAGWLAYDAKVAERVLASNDFHSFDVDVERGHTQIDPPVNPLDRDRMGLSWSDDGGKTFTDIRWRDIPPVGDVKRLRWQMLGKSRDRIFRLETESVTDIVIVDAHAEIEMGTW